MTKREPTKFLIGLVISMLIVHGCATYDMQVSEDLTPSRGSSEEISHSFYVWGNMATPDQMQQSKLLNALDNALASDSEKSTHIFLGNTVQSSDDLKTDYGRKMMGLLKQFQGKTIFVPGKFEWSGDIDDLEKIEDAIDDELGKNSFLPENGCPVEDVEITDDITLIAIDSQWYLSDWDNYPKINVDCNIRDRESFFLEIEDVVKDNVGKTILFAIHHPMFSNGPYGGYYSFGNSMTPLPILGTFKNVLKRTGGFSTNSLQNSTYRVFKNRLTTLAQYNKKVIFLSGHEKNMQYLTGNNVHQIITSAGSKTTAVKTIEEGKFGLGKPGYARLDVLVDGSSQVKFYELEGNSKVFESQILPADRTEAVKDYVSSFPDTIAASVYDSAQVEKSGFHEFIWGERYRKYYGTKVKAPTVDLDTLFGGLKVVKKGGGHQSKSLRLQAGDGRQYVMRALEKSADAYLQFIRKEEFIMGKTKGTAPNTVLKDFYTGDHPYAPFTIGTLADAVNIYHTNPVLYYIPKQKVLGIYNEEFGDKLFMIEEHASKGHGNLKSFGYSNNLISTDDLFEKISSDEKYSVDTKAYIRARLFDMLIGDWDRHNDQWRWAEFKDKDAGTIVYKPVPRDRDQAYSIMGDGFFMGFATRAIPSLRLMEGFDEEIRSVKGFNSSPKTFALDMYILPETIQEEWISEAKYIQENINEEIIDAAFQYFPEEVRDETLTDIKKKLLARKQNLLQTAETYFEILNKRIIIIGTDKDDHFVAEDIGEGITEVTGYRIKNGKKADVFYKKKIDKKYTKEIWIYGLEDKDIFEVVGGSRIGPKLRLIGGQNNDTYKVDRRRKTKIYDYKSLNNTFEGNGGTKKLSDDYSINTYDVFKAKSSNNMFLPTIGSNPDDGFRVGVSNVYTQNGFIQEPFTSQHKFNASFYFATSGYDLEYSGEFTRALGKASLVVDAKYTGPNFTKNFFGFGNETENFDDDLDFDFNRVKMETLAIATSLLWTGKHGSEFRIGASFEEIDVEETDGRFIEDFYAQNTDLDTNNSFWGVDAKYSFENSAGGSFPVLGLATSLHLGYRGNTEDSDRGFGYVIPSLSVNYKLVPSGNIVLGSKLKAHLNLGNDFEFFQGASIGADDGLRGYRFQRFTGKRSYYQSTDLRVNLKRVRTSLIPLSLGVFGGFDYGRVWVSNDDSNVWNTSIGGGFFVNGLDFVTASASIFNSDDGNRFVFGLGIGF
ncbi:MAG: phosphoesterase [Bacteroidota bacterium]